MGSALYAFEPSRHEAQLVAVIDAIRALPGRLDGRTFSRLLCAHPKRSGAVFKKSELIRGFRALAPRYGWDGEASFVARVRMKPVRTRSGVAPVTVLTKPFPCPGRCIFCPSDVRMPKSYLSREPGAQRAAQHAFDPYAQTLGRLLALHHNGHPVDKVELIVLGGTWSSYPEPYRIFFVARCFDALEDFPAAAAASGRGEAVPLVPGALDFADLEDTVGTGAPARAYNRIVGRFLRARQNGRLASADEAADWPTLTAAQRRNERAAARCVGLTFETRPDVVDRAEARCLRRLGATKVQIGIQSLDDEVLAANRRGHDVATTRRAIAILRRAGFKIQAHWMANLHGSDPERDREDFARLFDDPAIRPDELKIYPCSLVESAELVAYHRAGRWRPYDDRELRELLADCLLRVPPWCRITRVIRDIPGDEILAGSRVTNLRQLLEDDLRGRGLASRDIRAREIGAAMDCTVDPAALRLEALRYDTAVGEEVFFQLVADGPAAGRERLAAFCRLALPRPGAASDPGDAGDEIAASAMIRELHVYGAVVGFDSGGSEGGSDGGFEGGDGARGRAQHRGLGRRLVAAAAAEAAGRGFRDLAVISAIGTRDYYRRLGFGDGALYQHLGLT